MKTINEFGIYVPEILLPKKIDLKSWSVIACDQYTQNIDYWKKAEETAGSNPSTLNLILPEIYLNSPDKPERIEKINRTMKEYLDDGVFSNPINSFIYIERTSQFGRTRKGLLCLIDLETYEWKPMTTANIRATEATIVERIPPRMEIRRNACLELPHIMLLANDKSRSLVEACGEAVKSSGARPLYEGELMCNGGSIKGWAVIEDELIKNAVNKIAEENKQADGSTVLFAGGDGNHSLATAKAIWAEKKRELQKAGASEEKLQNDRARFALVEIVNIYDEGLTFEPIHRVLFNADSEKLMTHLEEKLHGKIREITGGSAKKELSDLVKNSTASFGFIFQENGKQKYFILETEIKELGISHLQPALDDFIKTENQKLTNQIEIDYIHGTEDVIALGKKDDTLAMLLPPIAKESFFDTIGKTGPLPRKSFSMGEADEKRFYLECRKVVD